MCHPLYFHVNGIRGDFSFSLTKQKHTVPTRPDQPFPPPQLNNSAVWPLGRTEVQKKTGWFSNAPYSALLPTPTQRVKDKDNFNVRPIMCITRIEFIYPLVLIPPKMLQKMCSEKYYHHHRGFSQCMVDIAYIQKKTES